MARNAYRPGRTLVLLMLAIAVVYGGLAVQGDWQPRLGLDLQGGTRITLQASTETGEEITPEKLAEAAAIIESRVNGTGVAEAEVATQGEDNIVVEIPGQNRKDLVETVQRTAQLRFRLVAGSAPGLAATPAPDPSADPSGGPTVTPSGTASGSPGAGPATAGPGGETSRPTPSGTATSSPRGRALSSGLLAADGRTEPPAESPAPTRSPRGGPNAGDGGAGGAGAVPTNESSVQELLAWARNPSPQWVKRLNDYTCPAPGQPQARGADDPSRPLITCDAEGQFKYLLTPAVIEGTQLDDASFGTPQGGVGYVVTLDFDGSATETFGQVTQALVGTGEQFAIVLDGTVLSAPQVNGAILNGNAEISGDFTQAEAQSLSNSLRYGALPLKFDVPVVTEEGPTLASDQLSAGLWAGGLGLALVLVYCMFYYRGLGLVVLASLAIAAAITYAAVLLLGEIANFTLTLPGIAGLIVGVGITADSFIVYFERIRDEMREGKSMRVAVEAGWVRARNTCLAADAVSMLAAVVLYIFAIGVVKGFAFALGLSTAIDVLVFFLFTKPMVSWLARFKFFNSGHSMSGLSAETVGIEHIGSPRPAAAGGAVR